MDSDAADSDVARKPSAFLRACDLCRSRKIRCDKSSPCSNCRASQAVCRTTLPERKDKQQRVLISTQYEQKIDRIEERLTGIERVLQSLAVKETERSLSIPVTSAPVSLGVPLSSTSSNIFEGESSMAAHASYASNFIEKAVDATRSPEMFDAVHSLRSIVERQSLKSASHEVRFPHARPNITPHASSIDMPPAEVVSILLKRCKERFQFSIFIWLPALNFEAFVEMCKSMYFCFDGYSTAHAILVTGGLYYLFEEAIFQDKDIVDINQYQQYAEMCRDNLETCLANLPMLMAATFDNIMALLFGAAYTVDISKPSLCWNLITMAVGHCFTLGYYRYSSMRHDSDEQKHLKMHLFWSIYTIDKGLSLRLGRPSVIQDYDISLPDAKYMKGTNDYAQMMLYVWVRIASIQGRIYEHLYSPKALAQKQDLRTAKARELAQELEETRAEYLAFDFSRISRLAEIVNGSTHSNLVIHYANLTLIYRAIPPGPTDISTTFSTPCIETARQALEHHQASARRLQSRETLWAGYLHWTVLQTPFAPFSVIFCHAVATQNAADLRRLEEFVTSLQSSSQASDAMERLYRLCAVFYNVARLYISGHPQMQDPNRRAYPASQPQHGSQILPPASVMPSGEFDSYLTALGLLPNEFLPQQSQELIMPGITQSSLQPAQQSESSEAFAWNHPYESSGLGDWFSGNQYITGLLEDDMSYLQPPE